MKTSIQQIVAGTILFFSLSGLVAAGKPYAEVQHLDVVPGNPHETMSNFQKVAANGEDAMVDVRSEAWRRFHKLHDDISQAHHQDQAGSIPAAIASGYWSSFNSASEKQQSLTNDATARYHHLAKFQDHFRDNRQKWLADFAQQHMNLNAQITAYGSLAPLHYVNPHGHVNFEQLHDLDETTRHILNPEQN